MTDELNAVALEPCPFCGGKAEVGYIRDGSQVRCTTRDCWGAGPPQFHGPDGKGGAVRRAIAAWNRRALPPLGNAGEAHPCQDCGGSTLVWSAPNELWNLVMGGPKAKDDPGGFLCPTCFAKRCAASITALVAERDGRPALSDQVKRQIAATTRAEAAEAEAARLREALAARDLFFEFVHRWTWGNRLTEKEALSAIQHHPMLTDWAKRRARTASETWTQRQSP